MLVGIHLITFLFVGVPKLTPPRIFFGALADNEG